MINWIDKNKRSGSKRYGTEDVYVSITKRTIKIIFYDLTCFKGNKLVVGVDGNRLYFKESENGYRMSQPGTCYVKYLSISKNSFRNELASFEGSHELKYDKDNSLYYIEKEDKNEKA